MNFLVVRSYLQLVVPEKTLSICSPHLSILQIAEPVYGLSESMIVFVLILVGIFAAIIGLWYGGKMLRIGANLR